jgi:hypothetical protein
VAEALLTTAFGLIVAIPLLFMYHLTRTRADDLIREIEERGIEAILTLDRKARRSIRLIEDIEERIETKDMKAAKAPPDLAKAFEDWDLERSIKTSVNTAPAKNPSASSLRPLLDEFGSGEIDREGATQVDIRPPSEIRAAELAAKEGDLAKRPREESRKKGGVDERPLSRGTGPHPPIAQDGPAQGAKPPTGPGGAEGASRS